MSRKKDVPWIGRVRSTHVNKFVNYPVWWPYGVVDDHARLALRRDAGSNPARDTEFFPSFQRRVSKATGKLFTSFFHFFKGFPGSNHSYSITTTILWNTEIANTQNEKKAREYWPWRRLALLVEILANKFCPSAIVPALQSIWFYNT